MAQQPTERPLEDWVKEYEKDPQFIAEGLATDIVEEAARILKSRGLNQSWLAEQMGVQRAYVSRIFNAPPNLTMLSVARIAIALDLKPGVFLDSNSYWIMPYRVDFNYEEVATDMAIWNKKQSELVSANSVTVGVHANATS